MNPDRLFDVERLQEGAISIPRPGEAQCGIEDVLVTGGAGAVSFRDLIIPKMLRSRGDSPVVIGIFQRVAGGGGRFLQRNIAQLDVLTQSAVPRD